MNQTSKMFFFFVISLGIIMILFSMNHDRQWLNLVSMSMLCPAFFVYYYRNSRKNRRSNLETKNSHIMVETFFISAAYGIPSLLYFTGRSGILGVSMMVSGEVLITASFYLYVRALIKENGNTSF